MVWALAGMTLPGAAIASPAVALIDGVPTHEFGCPGPRLIQAGEALGREITERSLPPWPGGRILSVP
jgi:hypothetical protein